MALASSALDESGNTTRIAKMESYPEHAIASVSSLYDQKTDSVDILQTESCGFEP